MTVQASDVIALGATVNQIDESTQQHAALAEEVAGAAGSLRGQTRQLETSVSLFRPETTAA